jgi:F-type H+-transporting ATPase subunit a
MRPLLRGGNADLNMTFAMAAVFMLLWFFWALRFAGPWGFVLHLFGPKGDNVGFIKYMMIVIFFCVGFLEVISIAFRPVSLSFRLYGNVFAGPARSHVGDGAASGVGEARLCGAVADPVLFFGNPGRTGPGVCVHAVDHGLHGAHVHAR